VFTSLDNGVSGWDDHGTFSGHTKAGYAVATSTFGAAIDARQVRIVVAKWSGGISMRAGVVLMTGDVTAAGDTVVPSSDNSPSAAQVGSVIDGDGETKYLNFDGGNSGFTVTPSMGASTVTGLKFTCGGHAPERDPATFVLSGSSDGGGTFVQIADGPVPAFADERKQLKGENSASASNLQTCTDECETGSQCAEGLKCFQRDNGEQIPGCADGDGGGFDWDYCYDPAVDLDRARTSVVVFENDVVGRHFFFFWDRALAFGAVYVLRACVCVCTMRWRILPQHAIPCSSKPVFYRASFR
jgi:hypothetical protein